MNQYDKNIIGVVILNYENYRETIMCIESVLLQKEVNYQIVVVDNGSNNESYKILFRQYLNNKKVHILRTKINCGFAKGNNIGIKYIRNKLGSNTILLLNSDTILKDELYISKLISYSNNSVGVIGSEIILRNGKIQPLYLGYVDFPATLIYYIKLYNELYGFTFLEKYIDRILKKYKRKKIIHGCAFMLTPSYLKIYGGLYDKTFLYGEEILLYLLCQRAGLKQIYVSETNIFHKEDQSSKYLFNNRNTVKMKYILKSYKHVVIESFKNYMKK